MKVFINNLKVFFPLVMLMFLSANVSATAQQPDVLYFEGQKYRLNANPLEVLFLEKPDLRPTSNFRTSANYRGYVATFSINNGSLFIDDIVFNRPVESIVDDLFPSDADRFLNWYSGVLTIPLGEQVDYFHMAYATLYENYIMIRIRDGKVREVANMNVDEFQAYKNRQYGAYKETEDYREYVDYLESIKSPGSDWDIEWYNHRVGRFMEKVNIPFKP